MPDYSEDEERALAVEWANAQGLISWTPEHVEEEDLSAFPETGQLLFRGQAMQESLLNNGRSLYVHCDSESHIVYYHIRASMTVALAEWGVIQPGVREFL